MCEDVSDILGPGGRSLTAEERCPLGFGRSISEFAEDDSVDEDDGSDVARLITGAGGGWGDPRERARELVLADPRAELIDAEIAGRVRGLEVRRHEDRGQTRRYA